MRTYAGFMLAGIFLGVAMGCKSHPRPIIPSVPVNLVINLGNPLYSALNVPGGYMLFPDEGSRGIIVVRVTTDDVAAFDLHCPHDVHNPCGKAAPESSGLRLVCACCGSEWNVLNGQVLKGPSLWPLHNYKTSFDGMIIRVFN
ncbi:MAG: Rieske 2Fe-2S domain-containing protein [Flavobacteriales bacterium]|nr:Rieske 2Fe-2S domain-containing protein [Flavobacteriales bacterium]MCX7767902.1 Rieske 2Fe-2S domain-containing protein [Flavobacteriales bacterium]MDW8409306.1 Rieske 2Fe-2S domain-containing protein [Flavobacteriales bacterium]